MARQNRVQIEAMRGHGFVTPKEAARLACVSIATVYSWLRGDKVVGTRVGGSRYVSIKSLREHVGVEMYDVLSEAK